MKQKWVWRKKTEKWENAMEKAAERKRMQIQIIQEEARRKREERRRNMKNSVEDIMAYLQETAKDDPFYTGYFKAQKPGALTSIEKEAIQKLKFSPSQEGNQDCFICLDPFVPKIDVSVLSCQHRFHTRCLDKWLEVQGQCPACRASQQII